MFESLKIAGVEGQIKWSYLPAITFGPWSVTGHDGFGILKAQIVSVDEFRAAQRPLVAVVPAGRATWRWSVLSLQISGSTLTARLQREG